MADEWFVLKKRKYERSQQADKLVLNSCFAPNSLLLKYINISWYQYSNFENAFDTLALLEVNVFLRKDLIIFRCVIVYEG